MNQPRDITYVTDCQFKYSICVFVTGYKQYAEMVESFVSHGFTHSDCEYLYIDNTKGDVYEAFAGINKFLTVAKGTYIIICHQDLVLLSDGRNKLDAVLDELARRDPNWGVCGNAGGIHPGRLAIRITDPHGDNQLTESLPAKVTSLDENFLLVRRDANLAVSRDLEGFHLYGTDLCLVAQFLGYSAYVVDFHLRHLSRGPQDPSYQKIRSALIEKHNRALRLHFATTTTTSVFLGGPKALRSVLNSKVGLRVARRIGGLAARLRRGAAPPPAATP
jgi:hypothetical protein